MNKKFTKICTISALVILSGCAKSKPENTLFEGMYTNGFEVESFTPCGTKIDYWLNTRGEQTKALNNAVKAIRKSSKKPYVSMYIKFYGSYDPSLVPKIAEDYDGMLFMHKFISYSEKAPSNCKINRKKR